MNVLKSHNANFAIELARSPTTVTLLHFINGPMKIENFPADRYFDEFWKLEKDRDAKTVAQAWLYHPLGIALSGSDEALAAVNAIAKDLDWQSAKVVKVEKEVKRSAQGSSRAREILRKYNLADKKTAKPFYDECEAAGIDRKLAASVLCIERKKASAPIKPMPKNGLISRKSRKVKRK